MAHEIKAATNEENGTIVVAASQCLEGAVDLGQYAVAKYLRDCGVVSANDMTTASTVTKLMYLMGREFSMEKIKYYMELDIRGELTTTRKYSPINSGVDSRVSI